MADASGALIGSTFGGLGAGIGAVVNSAIAGPALSENLAKESISEEEKIDINAYVIASEGELGELHNVILSELEAENPDLYNQNLSIEEMTEFVVEKFKEHGYDVSDTDTEGVSNELKVVFDKTDFDSEEEMFAYYQDKMPAYENEIEIIKDFADNVEELGVYDPVFIGEYADGFKSVINESQLPFEKRNVLIKAIDVEANSTVLWRIE